MNKKYIYNIGYASYEESKYIQMYFDKELTNKELEKYVQEATVIALTKALNNEYEKEAYIYWGFGERGIAFQDLFDCVIKELENEGFEKVYFDASFDCCGWISIVKKIDHSFETNDTEIDRLIDVIPDELKIKALEKARQEEGGPS